MAEVRDFTDLAKQELFRLIDAANVNEPEWWTPSSSQIEDDWVGRYIDTGAIAEWEGMLKQHNQDIAEVKSRIKNRIARIWANVYKCEAEHAAKLGKRGEQVAELASEFKALADIMDPTRTGGPMVNGNALVFAKYLQKNFNTEKEYDHWMKAQAAKLAEEKKYTRTYREWENMSWDEKEKLLSEFCKDVCKLMGVADLSEQMVFEWNTGYGALYGWVKDEDGNRTQDRTIIMDNQVVFYLDDAKKTIIHEVRHAYQEECQTDYEARQKQSEDSAPLRHPFTSDATVEAWNDHEFIEPTRENWLEYVGSIREYDAWSFAGQIDGDRAPAGWPSGVKLDGLKPVYPGSWGERPGSSKEALPVSFEQGAPASAEGVV